VGKTGDTTLTREDIQAKVKHSQAFESYKHAADQKKEKYYFSHDLNCKNNGKKIDPNSLFCHSAQALKIKQESDDLTDLKYDLHIILVGTTLQPLMLSVSAINAINILLLYDHSNQGDNKKDDLFDYIKAYNSIEAASEPINSSKPNTVFSVIKKILKKDEWRDKKICIDITGGKKSMVGGGFLASSILGIDTYYIDFEKYENGNPVLCTEFLNKLENPYHIYNIQLLNQAKELFRNHDYAGANKLFKSALKKLDENIVKKYSLGQEKQKIEKMQKAAECYMYWDRFEYTDANNIEYVEILKDLILPNNINKIYEVANQFEYVKKLCFDRYENANRRFNQGRYEDALTRYSQSFEISCKSYLIKQIILGKITAKIANKDSELEKTSDTWKEWQIDYASIAGILNWLLCIQKLKWEINQLDFSLAKRSDTTFKDNFSKLFEIDNNLSNNEFIKKVESYSDLIEHRNAFIHVSSIAAKKEHVNKFRIFVFNFLQCLYGNIDLSPYTFSTEFNEDGAFIG